MNPKLLVTELCGLGDLAIATPFLRVAVEQYDVTLLAKPGAVPLQKRLWPKVKVMPFTLPWTAFRAKYRLWCWPWGELLRLCKALRRERFEVGLSARWDPRDHVLLALAGVTKRYGFSRLGSRLFLTDPLEPPGRLEHRYSHWERLARAIGLALPPREKLQWPPPQSKVVLFHTGAAQAVRVWPLERYRNLVHQLRRRQQTVVVACDPDQRTWWLDAGEKEVVTPRTIEELFELLDRAGLFIGNDSGPGHLAAISGIPTLTIFGPQLSAWFAPLHPAAEWVDGTPCPYKPCYDQCRFESPHCLVQVTEAVVWERVEAFVERHRPHLVLPPTGPGSSADAS